MMSKGDETYMSEKKRTLMQDGNSALGSDGT